MKYTINGPFVTATAETFTESAELLRLSDNAPSRNIPVSLVESWRQQHTRKSGNNKRQNHWSECSVCGEPHKGARGMTKHMNAQHGLIARKHKKHNFVKVCEICGKGFKGLQGIATHKAKKHGLKKVIMTTTANVSGFAGGGSTGGGGVEFNRIPVMPA